MASYKIVPLRQQEINIGKIKNRSETMSALESSAPLRTGTLPRSFETYHGEMCYVEYAKEEYAEITTLEGEDEEVRVADMFPIIFLGNGFVAYDANLPNKDTENEVRNTIADLLEVDIHFEPVTFDKDTLKEVVDQSSKVREADFAPETGEKPQKVSARHIPGLQDTELWRDYEGDPLEKVRVELPDETSYNVSFYEKGKITVHGRNIPVDVQMNVLRYITDEVVANLDVDSFQQTLGGVDE